LTNDAICDKIAPLLVPVNRLRIAPTRLHRLGYSIIAQVHLVCQLKNSEK